MLAHYTGFVNRDMEWRIRILLEIVRNETSNREILYTEQIHWMTSMKIVAYSQGKTLFEII